MKHLILIVTFLLPLLSSQAQVTDSISIIAIDNFGNTDTVVFGFAPNATTGVDTALGERDISSVPLADLDIRLIQRTTVTVDSFWMPDCPDGYIKPFEQELELKKDIRNNLGKVDFILKVHTVNYPVVLKELFLGDHNTFIAQIIPVCLHYENLNVISSISIRELISNESSDTILTINEEASNGLISFHPQYIVNVNDRKDKGEFSIYPNPVSDYVNIQLSNHVGRKLHIFNLYGEVMDIITVKGFEYCLEISDYPSGVYFVRNKFTTRKFIKQ